MRVSVVVPVYDQWEHLAACLRALEEQTLDASCFEVLVVDNGSSTPRPATMPGERLQLRWLSEARPGSYAARNAGLRAARADVLAFTDADCRPVPGWLEEGLLALEGTPPVDLVGGSIALFAAAAGRLSPVEAYELVKAFPQERYVDQLRFAATANLFARRSVFASVGEFEERLRSGGDREFGQRAAAAGHSWRYAPAAAVRHPARRTFGELGAKLARVVAGSRDARELAGRPLVTPDEVLRGLVPPIGAVRRAAVDPRLPRRADQAGYVLAEFYVRYVGTWLRLKSRVSARSPRA
nr:glycosyltransferase [Motilibacter aurantiacus]